MDNQERRKISLEQLNVTPEPDDNDESTYIGVSLGDEYVAGASVTPSENDGVMVLESLAVDDSFRRQGVGAFLFRHVVGHVLAERGNTLEIEVNTEHLSSIILASFPIVRVKANEYDTKARDPVGDALEPLVAHASLQHRREQLPTSDSDAMLDRSYYFTIDLR